MADIKELFSLKDRVAIVTGGGQGLGKSMAIGLAQAGANIVIAARRIEFISGSIICLNAICHTHIRHFRF